MRGTSWSNEELAYLRAFYPLYGAKPVAERLGRSHYAVRITASRLGLDRRSQTKYHHWSLKEIIFLEKWYPLKGIAYVARHLELAPKQVLSKARALKIKRKLLVLWSRPEVEYLWQWYGEKPLSEIARNLKRTPEAVGVKARKIGLRSPRFMSWSKKELNYVLDNYQTNSYAEIAQALNRSEKSISHILQRYFGIRKGHKHKWTAEGRTILEQWYGKIPVADLAKKLGLTKSAVMGKANLLGLRQTRAPKYSQEDKEYLRKYYLEKSNRQLAQQLGRSIGSIELMARRLGLTGTEAKRRIGYDSQRQRNQIIRTQRQKDGKMLPPQEMGR